MAMEKIDYTDLLAEHLTAEDIKLKDKPMPKINIAAAVPVTEGIDFTMERWDYYQRTVTGSVKNGIIGIKTNSLETIDTYYEAKVATVSTWGKAVDYTQQEAEKLQRLGVDVNTQKLKDLYENSLETIQYAGYLGHRMVNGQEGLLTGTGVATSVDATGNTIAEMTAEEFVNMILKAYDLVWARSNYSVQPTHIAMDAADYMTAMQKFDEDSVVVGTDLLPISAMDRVIAALRKASGNDTFSITFVKIPSRFAVGINGKKTTRLVIYTYDSDYLEMKVMEPQLLQPMRPTLLTYQAGYRAAFTGVLWKELNSAQYVDYKSS